MAKNILLLFLSPIPTESDDSGEVVIRETEYKNIAGEKTKNTNESAFRYLLQKKKTPDKIFIFASKLVYGEISGYLADDGKPRTHLEFFLERVKKFLPNADCEDISYNENNSGDEILKNVAALAEHIQNYAAQFPDEEITLNVDLTGGMRDVIMIILDLTRLLEYSGLKIGTLAYSDLGKKEVEPKNNIYDLFQLIAGVEEFVNFGSVRALNKYYEGKILSEPLSKLLNAMGNFAEAIKLCHYWQFRDAIINLHDTVRDFAPTPDNAEDILMARLIGRIRADYHNLIIERELNDFEVIRWCLEKGYLQQALILYTERIPDYLAAKNFIWQSEEESKKLKSALEKETLTYPPFYYLFNLCNPRDHVTKGLKIYCNAVKSDAVASIRNKAFNFDEWLKNLKEKLDPLKITLEDEPRLREQLATLEKIYQNPKPLPDLSSEQQELSRKILDELLPELEKLDKVSERRKKMVTFINDIKVEDFTKFFPGVAFAKNVSDKYPNAFKAYGLLYDKKFYINEKISEENFLSIMEKYSCIKSERNNSAHALPNAGEFKSADELRDFMNTALDEIKNNIPAQ